MSRMGDLSVQLMEFEEGNLDRDAVVDLFQTLVDTGLAWTLQGRYGRTANDMIDAGLIQPNAS